MDSTGSEPLLCNHSDFPRGAGSPCRGLGCPQILPFFLRRRRRREKEEEVFWGHPRPRLRATALNNPALPEHSKKKEVFWGHPRPRLRATALNNPALPEQSKKARLRSQNSYA